jgi:hypothetical protein
MRTINSEIMECLFRYSGSSFKAKVIPKGSEINRRAKGDNQ